MFSLSTEKNEDVLAELNLSLEIENAATKVLTRRFYNDSFGAFTIIRNIADHFVYDDYTLTINTFNTWLTDIEPKIAAIEGDIGFHVGPKKNERRAIKLDIDNSEHGSRGEASTHYLMYNLVEGRAKLTDLANRAICNVSHYTKEPRPQDMSQWSFQRGWRHLLSKGSHGIVSRKTVEKIVLALTAMRDTRYPQRAKAAELLERIKQPS